MNYDKETGWKRYDADMKWYERIREDVMAAAEEAGVSLRQQLKLELGFEEILVNIISYAYDDPGYVWVKTAGEGNCFRIEFADHGKTSTRWRKTAVRRKRFPWKTGSSEATVFSW